MSGNPTSACHNALHHCNVYVKAVTNPMPCFANARCHQMPLPPGQNSRQRSSGRSRNCTAYGGLSPVRDSQTRRTVASKSRGKPNDPGIVCTKAIEDGASQPEYEQRLQHLAGLTLSELRQHFKSSPEDVSLSFLSWLASR